jgi:TolB protein
MPPKRQEVRCVETNLTLILAALAVLTPMPASAQGPLRLEITEGVIEPLPFALPTFIAADGGATDVAQDITRVIAADLRGTGLFRQIPPDAYISQVTSFDSPVQYPDWQAINAQALITGEVETRGEQIVVRFRLFDVFSQAPLGEGLQFVGEAASWRRMAHTVADEVYERITGETGISTPASSSSTRKGRRTPASSVWRSWITTVRTCSS